MITETENNALQLAKRVFEHFTHDALQIAREIIAMENELGQTHVCSEEVNAAANPIPPVKKTDVSSFPVSEISIAGLGTDNDPAQPIKHLSQELVYQTYDDLPF